MSRPRANGEQSPHPHYSEDQRIAALEAIENVYGGNIEKAAIGLGIHRGTLRNWWKKLPEGQHSDQTKARTMVILEALGGNTVKTSQVTGIPVETISNWQKGYKKPLPQTVLDKIPKAALDFLNEMGVVRDLLLAAMPSKIKEASLLQTATAMAILIDKADKVAGLASSDALALAGKSPKQIAALRAEAFAKLGIIDITMPTEETATETDKYEYDDEDTDV